MDGTSEKIQPSRVSVAKFISSRVGLAFFSLTSAILSVFTIATVLLLLHFIGRSHVKVHVVVDLSSPAGEARGDFVCATLDWWRPEKCDYGRCSWGNSSILNLDLQAPPLLEAVQALSPVMLRLGGSLQDSVTYDVGGQSRPSNCTDFKPDKSASFGFRGGCLPAARWDAVFDFCNRTGCRVVFGLNAMRGRRRLEGRGWEGAWDPTNARALLNYTQQKGHPILAWELGNEIGGPNGIRAKISAWQYAKDLALLRTIVNETWTVEDLRPLVVAADTFWDDSWHAALLNTTGPGVLDVCAYHIYSLGAGKEKVVEERMMDPEHLDRQARAMTRVYKTMNKSGPWAELWVGEAGGAFNSGRHLATDAFMSGFWYLDQMAQAALHDHQAFCRQSLVGGNYGLLNTSTLHPNPDFYAALMWRKLMGKKALRVPITPESTMHLRVYAHCARGLPEGGVTLLLMNLSPATTYLVHLSYLLQASPVGTSPYKMLRSTTASLSVQRLEYHFTALNGDLHSQTSVLNGKALTYDSRLPELAPDNVQGHLPIKCRPYSYAFVVVPLATMLGCCSGSTH